MKSLDSAIVAALAENVLVPRDFIWFVARNRDTGLDVTDGYHSGVGTITADVIDPETGSSATRTFYGAGGLIQTSEIPHVSNLTVQTVSVLLSQVVDRIQDLVRAYDLKQAKVQIFRGLYDPDTRVLVAPAPCEFAGFVDRVEIRTPAENDEGSVILTCVSHTQEMTRSNPDTRSDASQKIRNATDDFFKDAAAVGEWEISWGKNAGPLASKGGGGGAPSANKGAQPG